MATDEQLQAIVKRCVVAMLRYQRGERCHVDRMTAEIDLVAGFVDELNLTVFEIGRAITHPVQAELIRQLGHEVGPRVFDEFMNAFEFGRRTRWRSL